MQKLQLTAQTRQKENPKTLRTQGRVPAVLYGHKVTPVSVSIDAKDLEKTYTQAGSNQLVEVLIDDNKTHNILFHEIQYDHLGRNPIHVDLYAVRMDEKIRSDIPIHFEGEAPAAYNHDAIIFKNLESIEVEALPADLPERFQVSLEDIKEIGDSVHVSDIMANISKKVEVLTDPEEMIIKADPPRSEEELEALEEAVPVEGAEADMVESEHGGDSDEEDSDEEQDKQPASAEEQENKETTPETE